MKERLQKLIASSGIASRRAAEEMIRSGRVTVNGAAARLGDSADIDNDTVCVDGFQISRREEKAYIMLNKPKGYVTTMSDEKGRRCVSELVKDVGVRVYPVGRLDMYSEGLLILTNDGELANRLLHPKNEIEKTYRAFISGKCSDEAVNILRSELVIDGYKIKPARVKIISRDVTGAELEIVIHEGRNRQIRKMCEYAEIKLTGLKRVSEGSLDLGELKAGKWRRLNDEELQELGVK